MATLYTKLAVVPGSQLLGILYVMQRYRIRTWNYSPCIVSVHRPTRWRLYVLVAMSCLVYCIFVHCVPS